MNFTPTTLTNNGDFIELTASLTFTGTWLNNNFRWGLFDGDDPVKLITTVPGGWIGYHVVQENNNLKVVSIDNTVANGISAGSNPVSTTTSHGAVRLFETEGKIFGTNTFPSSLIPTGTSVDIGYRVQKTATGANLTVSISGTDGAGTIDIAGTMPITAAQVTTLSFDSVALFSNGPFGAGTTVSYSNVDVTTGNVPPGDFNNDGVVDGADFLLWQRGGSPDPLSQTDLTIWETNYGTTPLSAVAVAVPEPGSFTLVGGGIAFAVFATRRRA